LECHTNVNSISPQKKLDRFAKQCGIGSIDAILNAESEKRTVLIRSKSIKLKSVVDFS
jgi:hypothetical protein